MRRLHRSIFLKELKGTFPILRTAINAQYGLLHLEMHVFLDFTQRSISLGNDKDVRLCFMIAEKYYSNGNNRMKNAIVVSFIEHLDFGNAKWAWQLLSEALRNLYLRCVEVGWAKELLFPA